LQIRDSRDSRGTFYATGLTFPKPNAKNSLLIRRYGIATLEIN